MVFEDVVLSGNKKYVLRMGRLNHGVDVVKLLAFRQMTDVARGGCGRMNSGIMGSALILSSAALSGTITSGFAGWLNPLWLSPIWTRLSSP